VLSTRIAGGALRDRLPALPAARPAGATPSH